MFTHVLACALANLLSETFCIEGSGGSVTSHPPLRLLPAEAVIAGWDLSPTEVVCLSTAHREGPPKWQNSEPANDAASFGLPAAGECLWYAFNTFESENPKPDNL